MPHLPEDTTEPRKTAFLIGTYGLDTTRELASEMLTELTELVRTLGLTLGGCELVHIREPMPKLLLGEGKAREMHRMAEEAGADVIVFDDFLTPSQQRNWESLTGLAVIDRQEVILDIFAVHARTNEARLQIELAQANYSLPRLKRKWAHFSRQGGASGSGAHGAKGEGEQQLELDSRIVRGKIAKLRQLLSAVSKRRSVQRALRRRKPVPVAAIVGYTNAGKSSLLNRLTDAGVLAEDKLFATLDATVRRLTLPGGQAVLLADTVGFIRKLPTTLVEAFKSTLEETALADYIIEVADASAPALDEHHKTTTETLEQIGATGKPTVLVLNKFDLITAPAEQQELYARYPDGIPVSARTGDGLDELLRMLDALVSADAEDAELLIPHTRPDVLRDVRAGCSIQSESYTDCGVRLTVKAPPAMREAIANWIL